MQPGGRQERCGVEPGLRQTARQLPTDAGLTARLLENCHKKLGRGCFVGLAIAVLADVIVWQFHQAGGLQPFPQSYKSREMCVLQPPIKPNR